MAAKELAQVLSAQDAERQRIARVLHDVVGHSLSRVLLELELLERARDDEEFARVLAGIKDRLSGVVDDIWRLARGLHPSAVEELGLGSAVEQYAREFESLHTIRVRVAHRRDRTAPALPPVVGAAAFRAIQEALLSVARHARASRVDIVISSDRHGVRLTVEDDGVGFAPAHADDVMGASLLAIRGRIAALGGTLHVTSAPGAGTSLIVDIPLEPEP